MTGQKKLIITEKTITMDSTKQYGYNRDFLKKYASIIELKIGNSAITLVPSWQGRVMTSTADRRYRFQLRLDKPGTHCFR